MASGKPPPPHASNGKALNHNRGFACDVVVRFPERSHAPCAGCMCTTLKLHLDMNPSANLTSPTVHSS
jgi:hypothetical protein